MLFGLKIKDEYIVHLNFKIANSHITVDLDLGRIGAGFCCGC